MRVVAALGGNAIQPAGSRGTAEEQLATVRRASERLADVVTAGHELVLVHGNGPQVGALLIAHRAAELELPPMPLDVLGAMTQGQLGYLLQQQLGAVLRARGDDRPVVTVLTQVVVAGDDPAFAAPDKPVGPHHTEVELEHLATRAGQLGLGHPEERIVDGAVFRKTPRGTWRRVVASPAPLAVVEAPAIRTLLAAGAIPVCGGGGGVPVVADAGGWRGVEAVVDKDATAALLARVLSADALLVLTDVDRVALGYGTPSARPLDRLDADEAERLLAAGEFPAGSMGPKVAAAVRVARAGRLAAITDIPHAVAALDGAAGTQIVADAAGAP